MLRKRNDELIEVGQVKPGSTFNVPLHALYAVEKELFFSLANYKTSVQGINWKESPNDFKYTKYLQCDPENTFEPFYLTAIREREGVYHEVTSKYTMLSVCYVIHLKPPLYLRNALPIGLHISVAGCSVAQNDTTDGEQQLKAKAIEDSNKQKEDFLDYGEKVVQPGDILHLPTVKTYVKEGEPRSLLVLRVGGRVFALRSPFENDNAFVLLAVGTIFGERLVVHHRNPIESSRIRRLVIHIVRFNRENVH